MSCIFWNVRGLGNPRAFRELKRLVAEKKPSLLFLCETRKRDINKSQWLSLLGFNGCFVVNSRGRSGGLCLMWKDPVDVTIHSYSQGHIDCMVTLNSKKWRFTGFYGHPDTRFRNQSWDLLQRLADLRELKDLPWIIGGDFNEITFDSEKLEVIEGQWVSWRLSEMYLVAITCRAFTVREILLHGLTVDFRVGLFLKGLSDL